MIKATNSKNLEFLNLFKEMDKDNAHYKFLNLLVRQEACLSLAATFSSPPQQ